MVVTYEPFSKDHWEDPYSVYAELREHDPVHWAPEAKAWCISRHEDVSQVLRRPDLFSSNAMATALFNVNFKPRHIFAVVRAMVRMRSNPLRMRSQQQAGLIQSDPPVHDELRNIVNRGFTPRRILAWEARLREVVSHYMAKIPANGPFDVVESICIPLPVTAISLLLGIDPERRDDFKRWSDTLVATSTGELRDDPIGNGFLDNMAELRSYIRPIVAERRKNPQDDLISVLVDPRHEGTLDENTLFGFIILLLAAGNETTTNLIGNATVALLRHPDQLDEVAADPSLVPSLVEETLRWDGPVQMLFRNATCDTEIAGQKIAKGDTVIPIMGSANRDERVFPDAQRFDVTRVAKGHVGFGLGVHFCLGASLARLEAKVTLEALVPLLADRRPSIKHQEWADSYLVRGRRHLILQPEDDATARELRSDAPGA
jgi:cytochrome P450